MRVLPVLLLLLAGCDITETRICAQTHYFTIPDSVNDLPDSVSWNLQPDSVVSEYCDD